MGDIGSPVRIGAGSAHIFRLVPPGAWINGLLELMVEGLDGSGGSEWPEIVWAHLLRLRREPGMGLAGLWDLADPLK